MMSSEGCANCGAELMAGAKFCRKCGAPSRAVSQSSVTEAETRIFQATDDHTAQTQYHDSRPTGLSYLAPRENVSPNPQTTSALQPVRVKRHGILWASAILFVLLLMFGGVLTLKWFRTSAVPASATKIDTPPQTGIAPPVAPQPPQPPTVGTGSGSNLIYPGAEITMEMTRGVEGSVRTLRTKDSVDKVIAWYTEKLKPSNINKSDSIAVLTGTNATAVITSDDGETNVVLKEGIDR